MMPGAESETPFPDSVTHHPKAVLAGGLVDSPRPQNLTECLKNRIPEDPEESLRFWNVCQHFSNCPRSPPAS